MTKNTKAKAIAEALLSKYPSHDFVIDRAEARSLGLPVHALEESQESLCLDAITGIIETGESIYGFRKVPQPKKVVRAAPKKKQPRPAAVLAQAAGQVR
jgi:hypothetical protein